MRTFTPWSIACHALMASLVTLLMSSFAQATDEMPMQPAITSALAAQSVMLSVARAGKRLVAVGERGFIIASDDDGKSWQQLKSPVGVTLVKVRFIDDVEGWAVGHAGTVLHTLDAGLSWTRQLDGIQAAQLELQAAQLGQDAERIAQARQLVDEGPDKPLLDVLFLDANTGWVVGAYGLAFMTHDGGQTWQPLRTAIDNPSGLHLYAIAQSGADLFIAGEQGTLLRSRDQGQSFQALASPYEGTTFGLQATKNGTLIAFGLRGKAFESRDGGDSWQRLDTLQPVTLTSGLSLDDGSVLLADESGRVLHFTGEATQAVALNVPQSSYFTGMAQAADGSLILSSARGMLSSAIAVDVLEHDQ
jgi:photosystem II stability/assembly factor-like uncharacterized protein